MPRRSIVVEGIVQGVGFRPFVHQLAGSLNLGGHVQNRTGSVLIEIEGSAAALDQFRSQLTDHSPPSAQVQSVCCKDQPARGDSDFRILPSVDAYDEVVFVSPDVATCDECVRELLDPGDRRYRYPFLNCTQCGPRLTILREAPYDRERTCMSTFSMCPACRAEYEDPTNRRFHAQPIACPDCGPRLSLRDRDGKSIGEVDPLQFTAEALRGGKIVALKGLGGYHLACDATAESTVALLRRRKQRDEKPLAVMVRDLEAARSLCTFSMREEELLTSSRRPIVLLTRRADTLIAQSVAHGNPSLGVMLPYTPLHHLLLRDLDGLPLVMTSGNRSDAPIVYEDHDACERMSGAADYFLTHDRPICVRCDDSVTRVVASAELPLRRSRGYAPQPIEMPFSLAFPILALGGQLKTTFALARDRHAFLSQHVGDLDQYEAFRSYVELIAHYEKLLSLTPQWIAHDLHPDYASTHYAHQRAQRGTEKLIAVQHHHAHLASCMAEHGLSENVIGVIFDGTGYGGDGAVWGGEFLIGDYRAYQRAAHFRYVAMPGGEQVIREPWRMAVAHLVDADRDLALIQRHVPAAQVKLMRQMIELGLNAPMTSSVGRLFDAVSALVGCRRHVSYEGQAAVELEWQATKQPSDGCYPFDLIDAEGTLVVDTRALITAIADCARRGVSSSIISRRFHSTLVEIIIRVCRSLRATSGIDAVVLSGGVFMNALLLEETIQRLEATDFRAYRHRLVPANDGGLCLGQLMVAAARQSCDNHPKFDQGKPNVPGNSR